MPNDHIDTTPATADRWADVEHLFGTRGNPARCWCQWDISVDTYGTPQAREDLHDQMKQSMAPGVLASIDGETVGWLRISPLTQLPRVLSPRTFAKLKDTVGDETAETWLASCFVVKVGFRRQGVSIALLRGGVEFAREHGARRVIGRPVDLAVNTKITSPGLYIGALSTFLDAGFHEVRRLTPQRALVELMLTQ